MTAIVYPLTQRSLIRLPHLGLRGPAGAAQLYPHHLQYRHPPLRGFCPQQLRPSLYVGEYPDVGWLTRSCPWYFSPILSILAFFDPN